MSRGYVERSDVSHEVDAVRQIASGRPPVPVREALKNYVPVFARPDLYLNPSFLFASQNQRTEPQMLSQSIDTKVNDYRSFQEISSTAYSTSGKSSTPAYSPQGKYSSGCRYG